MRYAQVDRISRAQGDHCWVVRSMAGIDWSLAAVNERLELIDIL